MIAAEGRQAIIVTASHNIRHILHIDRPRDRSHPATPPEFRAAETETTSLVSTNIYALYDRDGECAVCPISRSWFLQGLDIAYSVVDLDGRPTMSFRSRLAVDFSEPRTGDDLAAIAYTGLRATSDWRAGNLAAEVELRPTWRPGQVQEVHPDGAGICRWPCFETNISFDSGMSGGPVVQVGQQSIVMRGIVSSDLSFAHQPDAGTGLRSMAATLWPSLGTEIEISDGSGPARVQMIELVRRGMVDERGNSILHFRSFQEGGQSRLYWV